jgi:hypothetical protein
MKIQNNFFNFTKLVIFLLSVKFCELTAIVFVRIILALVVIVAFRRFWDALLTIATGEFIPIAGHEYRPKIALLALCG